MTVLADYFRGGTINSMIKISFLKKFSRLFFWLSFLVLILVISFSPLLLQGSEVVEDELPDYENALTQGTPILEKGDLIGMILEAIRSLLVFLGVTTLVMIVFSGLKWMMAGGNEETVKKAKMMLRNALIGLCIALLAYAIATWGITSLHGGVLPPMLFFL